MPSLLGPKPICKLIILSSFLLSSSVTLATTHWISPNGTAAWNNCVGDAPLAGTAACSLPTANYNAVAGDLIYLRGGIYTQTSTSGCATNYSCGIDPKNLGTATAKITYAAYPGETPIITAEPGLTSSRGISIHQGKGSGIGTYIRVTGITFHNLFRWANLYNYANYNEIDHCTFYSDTGQDAGDMGLSINSLCADGAGWTCYSKHNWIHHNTFSKNHEYGDQSCHEGNDMIRIGIAYSPSRNNSTDEQDDYNTVEYNMIEYAGHALMDTYGAYNVIRGNIFHNEGWITDYSGGKCSFPPMPNGKYGHRGLQTTEDYARAAQYILVEGNRFGFTSANPNNPGDANYAIASPATIVRYNYAFGSQQSGIGTKWYSAYPNRADALAHRGSGGTGPYNIRIYNNTAFWNGQTYPYMQSSQPECTTCPGKLAGINVYSGAKDIVVKNNISTSNFSQSLYGFDITVDSGKNPTNYSSSIRTTNNFCTTAQSSCTSCCTVFGDPMFNNPDISDPKSKTLPDLRIQLSSGAIDRGISLTYAKGPGTNSINLVVEDAMYFQDGTWGSELARGVTLFPDWIAIGTVANIVQISSINYSTNTITLAAPMSWADKANIWLFKKSDGAIVLAGPAPDLGASEFLGNTLASPTNFRKLP